MDDCFEGLYRDAVLASGFGAFALDVDHRILILSPEWLAMGGFGAGELPQTLDAWLSRVHSDDLDGLKKAMDAHIAGISPRLVCDYRLKDKGGNDRWMACIGQIMDRKRGGGWILSGFQMDMTDRKEVESQLSHHALHDALTHLPNRALFQERLSQSFLRMRRDRDRGFTLLFLDLDRFKEINDCLGHGAGDQLLLVVAARLLGVCRECDTVARLSGDEFTILLSDSVDVESVQLFAKRILDEVGQWVMIQNHKIYPSISIGIAICNNNYDRPDELMHAADMALYQAKQRGKGGFFIHIPHDANPTPFAFRLYGGLDQALKNQEMILYYQPFFDLKTGQMAGSESLLRWNHPRLGILLPDHFLSNAIDTRFILQLGQFSLSKSMDQFSKADKSTTGPLLSVNMTVPEMGMPSFVHHLQTRLEDHKMDPRHLMIDISPHKDIPDIKHFVTMCQTLRQMGVFLTLDGFGSGDLSLDPLISLPLSHLKLDKSWVHGLDADPKSLSFIGMVVQICSAQNIIPMATGIETKEQLDALTTLGIQMGQGYYFAPPSPLSDRG